MVHAQVRAYIAHTFKHRKYVKDKLTPLIHAIGIDTKNPFYEIDGSTKRPEVELADKSEIQGLSTSDIARQAQSQNDKDKQKWIRMVRSHSGKIVPRDLHFINGTDFTIAYLTDISCGTANEIFYTGVIKRRPVFLLTNNPEVYEHPWIIYSCRFGKICKTDDELVKALKRKYC